MRFRYAFILTLLFPVALFANIFAAHIREVGIMQVSQVGIRT
jgi:hypothetical protein